ncbi:Ig-like domain-containing protein [Patescibacteria group bacterium]|nr:Ig-like domain-containing protein [Patescibacteria group bacterium]
MRKIPTAVGLIMVVALVGVMAVTTSLVKNVTSLFSKASSDQILLVPADIANVSDTSFTVFWVAQSKTVGVVSYGLSEGATNETATDNGQSASHFIRVTGLTAATTYYVKVSDAPSGQPLQVTTKMVPDNQVTDPIFGKVTDTTGVPLSDAIVVWQTDKPTEKVAALTNASGSYVLPVVTTAGQAETVKIYAADGTAATISCTNGQDKPLPTVKIGDSTSCGQNGQVQAPTATSSGATGFQVSLNTGSASPSGGTLEVTLKNNETVSTPLPTIKGTAGPNQMVSITVHSSTVYSGTVKADPSGNWSWTPPAALSPGQHTATITVVNPDGTTQTITRTFYVSADTSILPVTSGTPSATTSHFACVNNACVKVNGLGQDTCSADADCAPAPTPTPQPIEEPPATPTATPENQPPAQPPQTPTTGALETTLLILGGGIGAIVIGLGLIL